MASGQAKSQTGRSSSSSIPRPRLSTRSSRRRRSGGDGCESAPGATSSDNSSSNYTVVAPLSNSSATGAMRLENATGSTPTQPNHSPHPTAITRPPRFDAPSAHTPPTHDSSPRPAVLRRKASSIGRPLAAHTACTKAPVPLHPQHTDVHAVLGIAMSPLVSTMDPIDEERRSTLDAPIRPDLSSPAPLHALSVSPSSRCSESPGRFSHSSSPTSMSSHSPGIVVPSRLTSRQPQGSLTTRGRPPPAACRELDDNSRCANRHCALTSPDQSIASLTSSSSTVLASATNTKQSMAISKVSLAPHNPLKRETPLGVNRTMSAPARQPHIAVQTSFSVRPLGNLPVYPPPELAHLAEPRPPQRPRRPSRDGTPDLTGLQGGPSPVVQSNLTKPPIAHHARQTSSGSCISPLSADASRRPSFTASPSQSVASTFSPVSAHVTTTATTTPDHQATDERLKSPLRPSPTKTSSRFAFFSKRSKSEDTPCKEKRLARKGPMAGTGHEGYGRYGLGRGRSTSVTSLASSCGRSTSQDSIASNGPRRPSAGGQARSKGAFEVDGFLKDRLTPKLLRGKGSADLGASTKSEASCSASSLGSVRDCSNQRCRNDSSLPAVADPGYSITMSRSGSCDSNLSTDLIPSASMRRRLDELDQHSGQRAAQTSAIKHASKLQGHHEPPSKPTRRWNFFQRAHSATERKSKSQPPPTPQPPGGMPNPPHSRAVAHYALDDPQDRVNLEDLEKLMEEAEKLGYESAGSRPPSCGRHASSILLPSPPPRNGFFAAPCRKPSPKVPLRNTRLPETEFPTPVPATTAPDARPVESTYAPTALAKEPEVKQSSPPEKRSPPRLRRLQQVGRIPQVVSTRDRQPNLTINSFSRPFVPTLPSPTTSQKGTPYCAPVELSLPRWQDDYAAGNDSRPLAESLSNTDGDNTRATTDCFSTPPRKFSTYSHTSSSGNSSFQPSTAIVPGPGSPPQEDEVWDEYDDLIDQVLSSPESITAKNDDGPIKRQCAATDATRAQQHPNFAGPIKASTVFEEDVSPRASVRHNSTAASVYLRRTRLLAALQALAPPSSSSPSKSTSRSLADEAGRDPSLVDPLIGQFSLPPIYLTPHCIQSEPTTPAVHEARQRGDSHQDAYLQDDHDVDGESVASRDPKPSKVEVNTADALSTATEELRHGALMVSSWLSFGRVLFSPAHFELQHSAEDRVLVLDGLGRDWSYYCAMHYPTARVYYISSMSANDPTRCDPIMPAPNYRQIYHPDLLVPLPFHKSFFTAVVFRFPHAASEDVYRSTISECKRVLRPGGHLEVTVLDLDLVNMGVRARRAVRDLKMRMQATEPNVCLMNSSDAFQRLIVRRGFDGLSRCIVGIPAAGSIANVTGQASGGRGLASGLPMQAKFDGPTATSDIETFADDGLSDMVARAGRWWYAKCYESMLVQPNDARAEGGIWSDAALLEECQSRQTSFRLLICYAQKPTVARRRTVSV